MKKLILVLFVCIAMVGCVLAAVPSGNMTVSATATAAPQLIGGSMGTYLVQANVNGANVTFGSDYKGVIVNGTLAVPVYTTGTPYRTITVQAPGYAVYTANITQVPGNQQTIDIPVTLIPATQPTVVAQASATAPATAAMTTTATSPAPTTSGSLPFAAFGAFVVVGILAVRSRR